MHKNFKKLFELAVKDNDFICNDQLYEQIGSVAIGCPIGPPSSNILKFALEQNFQSTCPLHFKPLQYCRYVDDTFCIF